MNMENTEKVIVTVQVTVNAPLAKTWKCWTTPEDIKEWNQASDDWCTTKSEIDLRPGGKFNSRMEARDGSMGFDFWGIYDEIELHKHIFATLGDGRSLKVWFAEKDGNTEVTESFEAENENPVDLQRFGWQAIINSFKAFVESNQ